jgi:DtxR family Mn-dependent transcriptional regulator
MPQPLIALLWLLLVCAVLAALFWPKRGVVARWRHTQGLNERVLIEDALKHLHSAHLNQRRPTIESLAGSLHISADRAALLLDRLTQLELVHLENGDCRLTPEGESYALNVLRAHRLWERYLADKTGFDETEWHGQADRREHTLSTQELASLTTELGNPSHDPHGDPIPTAEGEVVGQGGKPLHAIQPGQVVQIVHLEDEPDTVYVQLQAEGLYPGMQVQLIEATGTRVRFWADGDEHVVAPVAAANISVRPLTAAPDAEGSPARAAMVHLDSLKMGESGRVTGLMARCRGVERRRLLDLGIVPGTLVTAELVSPSGDPTAYRVRGALIALRKEQARLIGIQPQEAT